MTELADQGAATSEQLATDAASQLSKANRYAFSFLSGARNVLLDEMLFAGNMSFSIAQSRKPGSLTKSSFTSWRKRTP